MKRLVALCLLSLSVVCQAKSIKMCQGMIDGSGGGRHLNVNVKLKSPEGITGYLPFWFAILKPEAKCHDGSSIICSVDLEVGLDVAGRYTFYSYPAEWSGLHTTSFKENGISDSIQYIDLKYKGDIMRIRATKPGSDNYVFSRVDCP